MFTDICFPDGNEEEFIEMAKRLDISSLCFVYKDKKKLAASSKKYGKVAFYTENAAKVSSFFTLTDNPSRQFFESRKVKMIYSLEKNPQKESFHYRRSGLNQVLCKILRDKEKCYGISFFDVLHAEDKSLYLGRLIQNIILLRKYGVNTVLASFAKNPYDLRSEKELMSFGITLGMHPKEAKEAVSFFYDNSF